MPVKATYRGTLQIDLACCACGKSSEGFGALMDEVALSIGAYDLECVPAIYRRMKQHREECPGHEPELVITVA